MLEASAKHPAMLFYLDNHLSKKPPTKQELAEIARRVERETGSAQRGEEAARIASLRGINENYARELLELHTLGVDRSYRQDDVITVAEALTGWGIDMTPDGTREFRFARNLHVEEGGRFLGYVLRRDKKDGMALGERVLDILGKHDHTAEFVCTKLTRYLVNDEPPRKVVERAVKAYKKSDGEIPAVVRAIVSSDDFWSRENYRAKFKTPYEFVISALRATGAEVDARNDLRHMLTLLGQPLYNCDDPTGYYDTAEAWLDPGVMALRWRFAIDLAAGKVRGVHIPEEFYADLPLDGGAVASMQAMVDKVLPGGAGPRTLSMLLEVTREHESGEGLDLESWGPELLGLLLGSPEFQQQ